ncbi:NUDIX hydrolase [Streptococcus sp. S784/96/1]|uniref:NUDIX hydrolase n=1 Tax=Streptococcus sp. S784/96/1 TaxID=2653499 RepID=UPI00138720F7|nr:NUDIX domain-containing protein [Streptococcus sp. S784/96/1]
MTQDYISYIRSKVGHDYIFLTFAVGILTNEEGKILLQKRRDKGTWGLLGGCMELGEISVDTLIREFKEESGISIIPKRLLNVYTNFEDSYPNGDIAQTVGMAYEVEATQPYNITNFSNQETLELRFFTQEETKQITIVNAQHQLILDEYFAQTFQLGN